jgi:ABC-type branched-subunit amino acid transport system substrate-binding protein
MVLYPLTKGYIMSLILSIALLNSIWVSNGAKEIRLGGGMSMTNVGKDDSLNDKDLDGDVDKGGIMRMVSMILAIKDMEAKYASEGVTIKFAVQNTRNTFTEGAQAAIDLKKDMFGKVGVHAVVGDISNIATQAMGYILAESDIAHVSYGADSSMLSHQTRFPTHSRVYPAASYEAQAIAEVIYDSFEWKRVVVIYSSSTYGVDALNVFIIRAEELGLQIIQKVAVIPGSLTTEESQVALKYDVGQLSKYDARIFVLLLSDELQAQNFFLAGVDTQVLAVDTICISTSEVTTSALWGGSVKGNFLSYHFPFFIFST